MNLWCDNDILIIPHFPPFSVSLHSLHQIHKLFKSVCSVILSLTTDIDFKSLASSAKRYNYSKRHSLSVLVSHEYI